MYAVCCRFRDSGVKRWVRVRENSGWAGRGKGGRVGGRGGGWCVRWWCGRLDKSNLPICPSASSLPHARRGCICVPVSLSVSVCVCVSFFVCVSVSLSVCLLACLPACLPACLSVCLSLCLPVSPSSSFCLQATGNPPFSEFSNHIAALFHITSSTDPPPVPDDVSPG